VKKAQSTAEKQTRDKFGKDADGKYLDQKGYLEKRNALNQKEQTHQNMYDSVMDKLDDPHYTVNALQVASTVDNQVWNAYQQRLQEKMKEGGDEMTDQDARCYIDRYPDIDMFNNHFEPAPDALARAKMHYEQAGKEEGRNPYCAPAITDQQLRCYLENYDELMDEIKVTGWDGKENIDKLRKHWNTVGFDEGRETSCMSVETPSDYDAFNCGKSGELCQCTGTIFYTKLYNEGNVNMIGVNTTSTSSTRGVKRTVITSQYWSSSDPDTQPTTKTFDVELLQLDSEEEGPFDRNNDPFNKLRDEFEA